MNPSASERNLQEMKVVSILALGFGLVGLDRFVIMPLFPVIAQDLGLTYPDLGLISAALALTWGLAAIFAGRLADQIGVRAVLAPAALAFSGLVALTGLATGLGSLLLIRALMGFAEGAFVPAAIVATTRVSHPGRVGLNIGVQHMAMALFGFGIAPILATQLLKVLPSWQWIFPAAALPGVLMAYGVWRIVATDPPPAADHHPTAAMGSWAAIRHRSVVANALAMACWLSAVTINAALLPNYLTDHLHLSLQQMGFVLSGLGLGGVTGMVAVPALGDRFGYKRVTVIAILAHLAALSLFAIAGSQPAAIVPAGLFALLTLVGAAGSGVIALTVGPLTGGSVAPALAATATGIVVGCGEIVGGALAPIVVGMLAARYGITVVPWCAVAAVALGLPVVILGAVEPAAWGRKRLAAVMAAVVSIGGSLTVRPAHAMPIDTGNPDCKTTFDNTLKFSSAYRLKSASTTLTTDVNRFADGARVQMGRNVELLDGFVYGKTDINGMQAAARAGRHSLQWAETLFFGANGIAGGQTPADLVRQLMAPDAQFKEILRPANQLSGSLQIAAGLSVAAYCQLEWRPTLLPTAGGFLSTVGNGAERTCLPAIAPGIYLQRRGD